MKKRKTYNQPKQVVGKTPQQKRNQIYAYILAFAMVFWTIASVLGIIGFARGFEADTPSASAQGYAFKDIKSSSVSQSYYTDFMQIDLGFQGATVVSDSNEEAFSLSSLIFKSDSTGNSVLLDGVPISLESGGTYKRTFFYRFITSGGTFNSDDVLTISYLDNREENGEQPFNYRRPISTNEGETLDYIAVSCSIYNNNSNYMLQYEYTFYWTSFGANTGVLGTSVLYIDFPYSFSSGLQGMPLSYPFLSYWNTFSTNSNIEYDLGEIDTSYVKSWYLYGKDSAYGGGFADGYADGYADGESDGLAEGYTNGYTVGRQDGYTQGVAEANEYSFNGLFSSIFDVPVQTFTSLFSFDILGVDLSGLFFSILTVGIILAVVKWLIP